MLLPLLTATLAILLIAAIYRHPRFKWQGMVWLSVIFTVLGAIPLIINDVNPLQNFIPTQSGLFKPGSSDSILSPTGFHLCILSIVSGIGLLICALVKRHKQKQAETGTETSNPLTNGSPSLTALREKLQSDIDATEESIGDPVAKGREDGIENVPDSKATEPPIGLFEDNTRHNYIVLGKNFVAECVAKLKSEIGGALGNLDFLKSEIEQTSYRQIAEDHYAKNYNLPGHGEVAKIKKEVATTSGNLNQFENRIADLYPNLFGAYDWAKRTTTMQLITLGIIFSVIEFVLSWLLLNDDVGRERSLQLAGIAVGVFIGLSFLCAFLFQYLRRNIAMHLRLFAFLGYVVSGALIIVGLGLLIDARQLSEGSEFLSFSAALTNIGTAYLNLLSDELDIVIVLVNILAVGIFYAKCLLWFEKFNGYDKYKGAATNAQLNYDDLTETHNVAVDLANKTARDKSVTDTDKADADCKVIADSVNTLTNIKMTIKTEYQNHLKRSFDLCIAGYRKNNKSNRASVSPAPAYFNSGYFLCDDAEYFADVDDIDKFIEKHQAKIDDVANIRDHIIALPGIGEFSTKKINEFQQYLDNIEPA